MRYISIHKKDKITISDRPDPQSAEPARGELRRVAHQDQDSIPRLDAEGHERAGGATDCVRELLVSELRVGANQRGAGPVLRQRLRAQQKFGGDSALEMKRNFDGYIEQIRSF